jgi:release factor glutamine methyltransferase
MLLSVTVLEVIQRSADFLTKKSVDAPRLQAELLLAHVLKVPRMQLYLNFERILAPAEQDTLRELVKRRGEREPLQHIVGSISFCGLEILVNRHVLIPRPETELLAEQGWIFLNERSKLGLEEGNTQASPAASDKSWAREAPSALDFGTGSGCLAITLAVKCPIARVLALDMAPDALELARKNAAHHGVLERLGVLLGNGMSSLPKGSQFDLIVANPPYIPTSEIDGLQPEVRDYEPRSALDGGPDGLDFYRHLSSNAGGFLKTEGRIMLEFGDGQDEAITALFGKENWIVERVLKDYTQRSRILIARKTL